MIAALRRLCRVRDVDVIILARGGGSTDDLAAFNEEALVRAVAACPVPVVAAVGHEVDVTLVDFAADRRAATPSQAAELVVVDAIARRSTLDQLDVRLTRAVRSRLSEDGARLAGLDRALGDPRILLAKHRRAQSDKAARLEAAMRGALLRHHRAVADRAQKLAYLHPRAVIGREAAALAKLRARLEALARARVERRRARLGELSSRLDAMSPLGVLARGYAIATRPDGHAVRSGADVAPGARIDVRVQDARICAEVLDVAPCGPSGEEG
jgi:exodeoxyribonuclease VII large subunit